MRSATHEELDNLRKWIIRLVTNYSELNGHRICPYAHLAKMRAFKVDIDNFELPTEKCDVLVLICLDDVTHEQLVDKCKELNEQYPNSIFLPDSTKETYINGVQTNNGKYKLILCQDKKKLIDARRNLAKTDYYSFWSLEYYKEIVGDSLD